eukprot:CAMPEP_0113709008 /NCGR_PEP_ID=MMETSP0038_2-20120614/29314_1 /TAXON_ID=2898 /ORGANISM="Cryptomonas paramecium" /LENGTH=162 /DNA_ID=CAMNT_0000634809 /DNA_START=243 /DNA_END=729 /DNA_ORIENTATION=+ /assembly_acc=CAM_ASM_000170
MTLHFKFSGSQIDGLYALRGKFAKLDSKRSDGFLAGMEQQGEASFKHPGWTLTEQGSDIRKLGFNGLNCCGPALWRDIALPDLLVAPPVAPRWLNPFSSPPSSTHVSVLPPRQQRGAHGPRRWRDAQCLRRFPGTQDARAGALASVIPPGAGLGASMVANPR